MHPIPLLQKLALLKGNNTVLDVGTKDGNVITRLVEQGMNVDAIDIKPLAVPIEGVQFEQISVEDFLEKNTTHYDIVIARHVLPFTEDPMMLIPKLNAIADVFLFTCFGPEDDWHAESHVTTQTHQEILALFPPHTIKHRSETFEDTATYNGDLKHWHYHTFVIDNRA